MIKNMFSFVILIFISVYFLSLNTFSTTSLNIVSTSNINVMPTSTFDVDISVSAANRLVGFQFKLVYDETKFRLNSITESSSLTSGTFVPNINKAGEIIVTYVDVNKPITEVSNFKLFTLNFTTLQEVNVGDHDLLSLDDSFSNEFLTMTTDYQISSIETINYNFPKVKRHIKGDVNMNGRISLADIASIQLHLVGLISKPLTDVQLLIADVNGDGKVSIFDAARLQLYLAEFISSL